MDFLRPLVSCGVERPKLDRSNTTMSDQNTVPSIIVLEDKQSSQRSNREATSFVPSHPGLKDNFLRRVVRTRTTDTITEESIIHGNLTSDNKLLLEVSNETLSDDDLDSEYFLTTTVSSISIPSFSSPNEIPDSLPGDKLKSLDLRQKTQDSFEEEKLHGIEIRRKALSGSFCFECRDEEDENLSFVLSGNLSRTESENIIQSNKESFISYEDILSSTVDIADGISYDEDDFFMDSTLLKNSTDEKADLNYLCEESVQSNSVKSYAINQ